MSQQDWRDDMILGAGVQVLTLLTTVRDTVVIDAGSMMILAFFFVLVFTVVLGLATRTLLRAIKTLLKDEVTPLLGSARHTVQRVQGTTAFIGETTVGPIIRVYGVVAGARRMIGVLAGVTGRRRRRQQDEQRS